MKKTFLLTIAVIIQCSLSGQAQEKPNAEKRTDWWGDVEGYINQQDKASLDLKTHFHGFRWSGERSIITSGNHNSIIWKQ